jgi:hypothetical protein
MTPHELPTFEAQWWPVQLETVPGSGERLTAAVVVRASGGQMAVRQAISPSTLQTIFGSAGKGMCLIVGETVLEIDRQIKSMVPANLLELPFGNMALGNARDCLARDLNEVFDIAMRLSTAFSMSMFGTAINASDRTNVEARKAFEEWAEKVRLQVIAAEWQDQFLQSFNVAVSLSSTRKLRLGFMHNGYVAQFGVLRPGRSITADVRALKVKLFDLDSVRRDQLFAFTRAELLIGYQAPGDAYTRRQQETLRDSWDFVEHEAKGRNVKTVRCVDAATAARHLHASALAA